MSKVADIAKARAKRDGPQLDISDGRVRIDKGPAVTIFNRCGLCDREYTLAPGDYVRMAYDGLFVCPKCAESEGL